jgi:hypothetical protein
MRKLAGALLSVTLAALSAACVHDMHPTKVGVELEPLTEGWRDNLRVDVHDLASPVQFMRTEGPVQVAVLCFPGPRFQVEVRNESDHLIHARYRSPGPTDSCGVTRWLVIAPGTKTASGPSNEQWIPIPPGGSMHLPVDALPWAGDPVIDARLECGLEIEDEGRQGSIPISFRVARLVQTR